MRRISLSFSNFRDRLRAAVSIKTRNFLFFLALALVVFLAIYIRMSPILRGPAIIKAFDPWIQYYNAKYISEHSLYEYFHWHDYKVWYPEGRLRNNLNPGLPFTAATIFYIINFVGIPISLYEVCFYFPAFMGGLTILVAYYLGKEVLDRNCGLFTAFFLAFNTGHMQRTMAGFFDNETIGVFASLMTLLFFLKAIRTGKYSHSIISGVFLGYLYLSWGGAQYIFYLLPLIVGILVLMNKYNENVLIAYSGAMGGSILVSALYSQFRHGDLFSSMTVGGIFFFTFILLVYHLIFINKTKYPKFYDGLMSAIKWSIIPGALVVGIIMWIDPSILPLGIGGRFMSIISPLMRDDMHIVASVAEHMPSSWSIFYYNTLIPLILLPLGIYFCFKRGEAPDVFLILFLLTLFYFTGSMIRIILLFAPAAALVGSYGLVSILKIFGSFMGEKTIGVSRKRRKQVKQPIGRGEIIGIYGIVFFLCIAQVVHASDISVNQLSYSQIVAGGSFHDWEESLTWMKTNLQGTDVVVSWWDYGYWLTPIGNVTTVNDNATFNSTRIGLTGMAMMQTNEIYSAKVFQRLKADYVLVYFGFLVNGLGGDEGKWPWMLRICNDHYNHYKARGYEEDNWASDSVFIESEYVNESTGKYEDKWFDSQLVRLMFGYEATSPQRVSDPQNNYLKYHYASKIAGNDAQGISQNKDDNGNTWASHIPQDGQYDFKVFKPAYFSKNGMVKLYRLDYTALESGFLLTDPNVYSEGYGTVNIRNTGNRALTITDVAVNDESYNFSMSTSGPDAILDQQSEDEIWLDLSDGVFNIDDVVNITVTAQADALEGSTYSFNNYTSNFFVTQIEPGKLRINRDNSKVVQVSPDRADAYLEVENIGNSVINLNRFYTFKANESGFQFNQTSYLQGSSVLGSGDKAYVKLINTPVGFYPIGSISNLLGVTTRTGLKDETVFTSNLENYKLSILPEEREIGSDVRVSNSSSVLRDQIPIELDQTFVYAYDNGSNFIQLKVKNTGDTVFGLEGVNIGILKDEYDEDIDFRTINGDLILDPGEENTIIADAKHLDIDINDELGMIVKAIDFNSITAASDVCFIHAIRDKPDIKILKQVNNIPTTMMYANESGIISVKNTGNEAFVIKDIFVNNTKADITRYIHGDASLNLQEAAKFKINVPNLKINQSQQVVIRIETDTTAETEETLDVEFVPEDHEINLESETEAVEGKNLDISLTNTGDLDLEIDGFYINDKYVNREEFNPQAFTLSPEQNRQLSITLSKLKDLLGLSTDINKGDTLKIFVRTKEGAEDELTITVKES